MSTHCNNSRTSLIFCLICCGASACGQLSGGSPGNGTTTGTTTQTTQGTSGGGGTAQTAGGTGTSGSTGTTAPSPSNSNETVRYIGRFDQSDSQGVSFGWSASSILTQFNGTGIAVRLEELDAPTTWQDGSTEGNYYDVTIDGGTPTVFAAKSGGVQTYTLASGLSAGSHTVALRKLTEDLVGGTRFHDFTVTGGALEPISKAAATRHLLVIGDSISAGYGNEGTTDTCQYTPGTQNAAKTYGYLTAQTLTADLHLIAWSGRGMYRNNDGTTSGTLPQLYTLTNPADSNSTWLSSNYVPDAIIINLGTNDFANGTPSQSSFQSAYVSFVQTLLQQYPKAHVFPLLGPMLSDDYPVGEMQLTTAREYINGVISTVNDPRVHALTEFPVLTQAGEGCMYHPNTTTHANMAQQLAPIVATALGW